MFVNTMINIDAPERIASSKNKPNMKTEKFRSVERIIRAHPVHWVVRVDWNHRFIAGHLIGRTQDELRPFPQGVE